MSANLDSPGFPYRRSGDAPAPVRGLVLAGGRSGRMGQDKGLQRYHGSPQVLWLTALLRHLCESVRVSVSAEQLDVDPYRTLLTVVDATPDQGPAGGLLAAWDAIPETAWLAVAVDMPFVDLATLETLLAGRGAGTLATAFRHPDGVLEPVCALWEPHARPRLRERLAEGDRSLTRLLEAGPTTELVPPRAEVLESVNTPAEHRRALRRLAPGSE